MCESFSGVWSLNFSKDFSSSWSKTKYIIHELGTTQAVLIFSFPYWNRYDEEPLLSPKLNAINTHRKLSYASNAVDEPCYFPQRVLVAILMFLGLCTVYILRVNLSVAIIPMSSQFHWQDNTQGNKIALFNSQRNYIIFILLAWYKTSNH